MVRVVSIALALLATASTAIQSMGQESEEPQSQAQLSLISKPPEDEIWSHAVTDVKSKKKKPAYSLVRPLWMDPRETWRTLQQNAERSERMQANKRNKQVHMIARRLNKSLLRMQTTLVAFRWNLQRTVPLKGKLSKIAWSSSKGPMSLEFCGSGSGDGGTSESGRDGNNRTSWPSSPCHSADGTSFVAQIRGLYQLQFNGIFWAREKGKNCSGCPESVSMQVCLDDSCKEPGIVSMAPVLGKTFHGSAWGLLWLEPGQTVSVFLSNKSSSVVKLKRSGSFFSGHLIRQAPAAAKN